MELSTNNVGILTLATAVFFSGCTHEQLAPPSTQTERQNFRQIDENTYLFRSPSSADSIDQFGESLSKFRREVPGTFTIKLEDPAHPSSSSFLVIRETVESSGSAKNTLHFADTSEQPNDGARSEQSLKKEKPVLPRRKTCEEVAK